MAAPPRHAPAPGKPALLAIQNRQRLKRVPAAWLRRIISAALAQVAPGRGFELCFHLVSAREMARVNWQYLQHAGPTDVITFDLATEATILAGEVYICVAVAVEQARQFGTNWRQEVARYAVHGLLHLLGHDDTEAAARRRMKRVENRVTRQLSQHFSLSRPARRPTLPA
jgi:rRNA maturation RNase YbeY